jgi:hypothetical protein
LATMKGSRYRGKGGDFGVLPERPRGHTGGGRKYILSLNPQEMTMRRRVEMKKREEITPSTNSSPP